MSNKYVEWIAVYLLLTELTEKREPREVREGGNRISIV